MGERPQLRDPLHVHDVRPVDAQEAIGIEHALDRVHRHVQQMRRRADVQPDVVLEGFDPVHILHGHEERPLAGSHREARELPRRVRDRVEHREDLARRLVVRRVRSRLAARSKASAKRSSVTGFSR